LNITVKDISIIFRALGFAAEKHKKQHRKGGLATPYINHLIDVAEKLWEIGNIRDFRTISAGILHDTIEDTETSREELESKFGKEVCSIVLEVTDDKRLPKATRRRLQIEHAASLSFPARQVKLADKISNIQDIIDAPPINWSVRDKLEYVAWGEDVVNRLRGTNKNLERYFDSLCRKAQLKFKTGDRNPDS